MPAEQISTPLKNFQQCKLSYYDSGTDIYSGAET